LLSKKPEDTPARVLKNTFCIGLFKNVQMRWAICKAFGFFRQGRFSSQCASLRYAPPVNSLLQIKPDAENIPVLNDVIFPLQTEAALLADPFFRSAFDEIIVGKTLGADEAL